MPWSGGSYSKGNSATGGWVGDASLGIGIEAGRHDTQDNDFATGINTCLTKDGSNTPSTNLPMGAYKHTNVANGTARNDYGALGQVQDGIVSYLGTTGGTTTAFTVTATPTITTLTTGAHYRFKANAANTGASTLKIDGTAATTMQRQGTALVGGEFKANDIVEVVYDGTNFQITNLERAPLFVDRTNNRVGVGTTAPAFQFHVDGGAANSTIHLTNSTTGSTGTDGLSIVSELTTNQAYIINRENTDLIFRVNNTTEGLRIRNDGNIGIGTPGAGNIRLQLLGSDSTSANYACYFQNQATSLLFFIRNDGLFSTGSTANAPYNNTTASAANLFVTSGGTFQRSTSSLKYKTDVQPMVYGLSEVLQLRPVSYKGKNDGTKVFCGLIAEEVDAIGLTEFVQYADDGTPDALAYGNMVALAFKAIQELEARVTALEP